MLASVSLDGLIIIWDIIMGSAKYTISVGNAHFKGIAWDPRGEYLAVQAEHQGVFIYSTKNFSEKPRNIKESFQYAPELTSNHLKLSWTPNGDFLTGFLLFIL